MHSAPDIGALVTISELTTPILKYVVRKVLGYDSFRYVWQVEIHIQNIDFDPEIHTKTSCYIQYNNSRGYWIIYDMTQPMPVATK